MVRLSAVLFLCLFAAQAAFLVLGPILPAVADEFGTTSAAAGQLRTLSGIAGGITAIVLVLLGRRVSLRPLLFAGLWLVGVASAVSAAAPTFTVLAAAQLGIGVGIAALLSGAVAAAAEWAPPESRSRVLAWAIVGQPASWVVGMPAIGMVADLGWRYAFAVPCLAGALALTALGTHRAPSSRPTAAAPSPPLSRDREVMGWAVGELLAYAGWSGAMVYAGALLLETYHPSPALTGLLLGAGAVAYFPGVFLARRWVDSHSRRLLIVHGLALSCGIAVFGLVRPSLWLSAALFAMLVFVAGGRTLAGAAHGVIAARDRHVTVTSVRTAATQFGNLLGVGLGGAALAVGGYGALGAALGVLFLVGVVPHVAAAGFRPRPAS